jgi:hypothetical protein
MNDSGNGSTLARIDTLTEMVARRLDKLEERLRLLEQDNGEIINLLIAVKAELEPSDGFLIEPDEDGEIPSTDISLH